MEPPLVICPAGEVMVSGASTARAVTGPILKEAQLITVGPPASDSVPVLCAVTLAIAKAWVLLSITSCSLGVLIVALAPSGRFICNPFVGPPAAGAAILILPLLVIRDPAPKLTREVGTEKLTAVPALLIDALLPSCKLPVVRCMLFCSSIEPLMMVLPLTLIAGVFS